MDNSTAEMVIHIPKTVLGRGDKDHGMGLDLIDDHLHSKSLVGFLATNPFLFHLSSTALSDSYLQFHLQWNFSRTFKDSQLPITLSLNSSTFSLLLRYPPAQLLHTNCGLPSLILFWREKDPSLIQLLILRLKRNPSTVREKSLVLMTSF